MNNVSNLYNAAAATLRKQAEICERLAVAEQVIATDTIYLEMATANGTQEIARHFQGTINTARENIGRLLGELAATQATGNAALLGALTGATEVA